MELTVESMIMNGNNFEEKIYKMIESMDIGYSFIREDKNGQSKFKLSIKNAKNRYSSVREIIESVLSDLKKEWICFDEQTKIIIKEDNNEYLVTIAVALNLKLLTDWNLERALYNIKNTFEVKLKRDEKTYNLQCGYGVYDNEWYLVAVEESLSKDVNMKAYNTDSLKHLINYQKEDMEEENYSLTYTAFFCVDNKEDYNSDYYYNKNIESYGIKDCYIENNIFMIELC